MVQIRLRSLTTNGLLLPVLYTLSVMVGDIIQVGKRIFAGYATPRVEMLLFVLIACYLEVLPWEKI